MLITKEVDVSWFHKTKDHYVSKGYTYTKPYDKFKVKIEDLSEGSHVRIELCCDYCGKHFTRQYGDHVTITKRELIDKDACKDCKSTKQFEKLDYKLDNNMLDKSNNGYWRSKENRMRELKLYIEKYNSLKNLYSANKQGFRVWHAFGRYKHDLYDATLELGYNPDKLELYIQATSVYDSYPEGFFDDFDNLSGLIDTFIKEYKHFPTADQLYYEFKITRAIVDRYNGMEQIRNKMNYVNKNEYVDDNNFKNKSSYEFIVAQFLIHNGVNYLREQHPFPDAERSYRSDFTFNTEGNIIHCEIWGFMNSTIRDYEGNKNNKIKLYKKYNLELISIEQKFFLDSYENIQNKLKILFEPILNKTMNVVKQSHILTNTMSDEELFDALMKYSDNKSHLPNIDDLKLNGKYCLYNEAFKRYGSYNKFALKFNLNIKVNEPNYWNKEVCLENGLKFLNDGIPIHQPTLRKLKQSSLLSYAYQYFGDIIDYKFELFKLYDGILPEYEIKYLSHIINNTGTNIKNKVTPEQQKLAKTLLEKYNKQITASASLSEVI